MGSIKVGGSRGWGKIGAKEYEKNSQGVAYIPLSDIPSLVPFHDIVKDNPNYYGTEKYQSLKHSIESDGYDESFPVWVYRGRIVDGWHRITACKELGMEVVPVLELPYRTSLKDIEKKVMRTEIGRQMSPSQLAIKAWKKLQDGTFKNAAEAALAIGSSEGSVKAVAYVANHGDADWIDQIFMGKKVRVGDLGYTDSIFTVKSNIIKMKKDEMKRDFGGGKFVTDDELERIKNSIMAAIDGIHYEQIKRALKPAYEKARELQVEAERRAALYRI